MFPTRRSPIIERVSSAEFSNIRARGRPSDPCTIYELSDVPGAPQYRFDGTGYAGDDDDRFGVMLERYGAVFNGTSDDAPAIQSAFDAIAADGRYHRIVFPQGLTAAILTPSGDETLTDGKSYVGLTIPGNLSVDFNGCMLDASGSNWGSADTVIALVGGVGAADSYSNNLRVIERGKIKGNSSFDDLVFLGDKDATGVPHSHFRNMVFTTATAIVTGADNYHQLSFDKCQFHNWGSVGYALTTFGGSSNWGENIRFNNCGSSTPPGVW